METNSTSQIGLTITPGIEDIAIYELQLLWAELFERECPEVEKKKGKLYINCEISEICKLIPFLRIPSQVYLLISTFTCKDSPKLYNRISKINWSQYLRGINPIITASAKESKLINTALIKEKAQKAIENSNRYSPIKSVPKEQPNLKNKIHIDIYNDIAKIELSLCGERLDKRGVKLGTDLAPMRESIAAAMLYKLSQYQNGTLRDPMCGTGTFTSEAAMLLTYNNHRTYDFTHAPFFITLPLGKRAKIEKSPFEKALYSDNQSSAMQTAKNNISKIKTSLTCTSTGVTNFFDLDDLEETNSIILNPPYGKRIKIDKKLNDLITEILSKAKTLKNTTHACIIFPKWAATALKDTKVVYKTFLKNGGIDVVMAVIDLH